MMVELVKLPNAEPVTEVVDLLERLLNEARSGELHSIAFAALYRNNETQTSWATGPDLLSHFILAGIVMLQRDWEDNMLGKRHASGDYPA